ncbi:MAG: lysostaphin resistance A-like protein [Candidatus Brocadiales bacterium]
MNTLTVDVCPWNLKDVAKVFGFFFFMMLVGSPLLLWLLNSIGGVDTVEYFGLSSIIIFFSMLTNILTCLYVCMIVRVKYKQPFSTLGVKFVNLGKNVTFGFSRYLAIIPVIILAGVFIDFVARRLGATPNPQEIATKILEESSSTVLVFMIFFGTLVAPLIEEFLFRGFLQPAVRCVYGKFHAIMASGFIFALIHLIGDQNIYVFFQILILGIFLAYLFEHTGSLVAPISAHVIHNSITISYLFLYKHSSVTLGCDNWIF